MPLLLGGCAPRATTGDWRTLAKHAAEARQAGDWESYRHDLDGLLAHIGRHPRVLQGIALAEAHLGRSRAAAEALADYCALGLAIDPTLDDDRLRSVPGRAACDRAPVDQSTDFLPLADADLLPEDVAWDGARFLISSLRQKRIVTAQSDEPALGEFARTEPDSAWAVAVDRAHKIVWATSGGSELAPDFQAAQRDHSAVLAFDYEGHPQRQLELRGPGPHLLSDAGLDGNGVLYVSDVLGTGVYRVASDTLEVVVPPGALASPQQPLPLGDRLLVPDYGRGIARVTAGQPIIWLAMPRDLTLIGIDGLSRCGRDIIAVQNGTNPQRVLRLEIDAAASRVVRFEVLVSASPQVEVATHGTCADGSYVLLSRTGGDHFDDDGHLKPGAAVAAPSLRKIALPH